MAKKKQSEVAASTNPLARCRPRGDRVVVRRDLAKTETAGGLILPDSVAKMKQQTGTVVSVGPGRSSDSGARIPVGLSPDDRVIITGYAGLELRGELHKLEDEEYVILREEDVVAILGD